MQLRVVLVLVHCAAEGHMVLVHCAAEGCPGS